MFSVAIIMASQSSYGAVVLEGPIARNKLKRDVHELFCKEKFGELETLANELRETKARFPDGHWKLEYYYEGLSKPTVTTEEQWKRWFKRMERWQRSFPKSITVRVATSSAWLSYGWQARGSGYANTVSKDAWEKLAECTEKALAISNKAPAKTIDDCPARYAILLTIGRNSGFDSATFFDILNRAIKFEPRYYSYYAIAMDYLTPRWFGKNAEWISFVENVDSLAGRKNDREIYTRLMIGMWQREWKTFDDVTSSWAKMKKGFEDMEREYPNSRYNLNNFCMFSCLANDKLTARKLFARIGNRPYIEAWNNVSNFNNWQNWAQESVTPEKTEPNLLKNRTEDFIETMHLAEHGDLEAQFQVGLLFEKGEQVSRDYAEAEKWYRKAAEQGHPDAMLYLAMLYFNGNDIINKDFKEVEKWYRRSALKGYDDNGSQGLGNMYLNGIGVEKDLVKAYIWYSQIFRWEDPNPEQIASKLTPEQLKLAKQEAEKLKKEIMKNRNSN